MGKIIVVDSAGNTVKDEIADRVFTILKAAFDPGAREVSRKTLDIMNGIAYDRILKKADRTLTFFKTVEIPGGVKALIVAFAYTPEEKVLAQCSIILTPYGEKDDIRVFFVTLSDLARGATELRIEKMEKPLFWLPELKKFK